MRLLSSPLPFWVRLCLFVIKKCIRPWTKQKETLVTSCSFQTSSCVWLLVQRLKLITWINQNSPRSGWWFFAGLSGHTHCATHLQKASTAQFSLAFFQPASGFMYSTQVCVGGLLRPRTVCQGNLIIILFVCRRQLMNFPPPSPSGKKIPGLTPNPKSSQIHCIVCHCRKNKIHFIHNTLQ